MKARDFLETVCERLKAQYDAYTILLYGSLADGSANADSDLDIAAFSPVDRVTRVAEIQDGIFIDAFIYPESVLDAPEEEHLRFRGAEILFQKTESAAVLFERLDELYVSGPAPLPADEITVRRIWATKMVARMQRADAEGNYRRHWLLTALLEDYFHLRGLWFEGPKKALSWLRTHDSATLKALEAALEPGAPITSIEIAVDRVLNASVPDPEGASGFDTPRGTGT
ncbi:nucleotidyltransferase domain-containing protein [Congregibacter litoralis]|uniref:Nucleotidyltransferase domain protein n=1 Tax=Congregibacter litoralis KT71 TaxID=314285 RepID=A4A4Q3_9GAMM|nr:nucleotidyltransferase domain-containing protein [Congregibacter litoralis]EAQ98774.1 Nucleotidyltransferase domain protein [Congregibacter litoralis KT71]